MKLRSADVAQLFAFALSDRPERADALLFVEGDGRSRPAVAADLYRRGFAKILVVTGEISRHPSARAARIPKAVRALRRLGVPPRAIIVENRSTNTREQAIEMLALAHAHRWNRIILAVAAFHQPRAYATFIAAMRAFGPRRIIINYPVIGLPWFAKTPEGNRARLLRLEAAKIERYVRKGHAATAQEVLAYQRWKENQPS